LALAALCLTAPASAQISSFQHIILVIQENRTPDNLFHELCTTRPCSTQPGPQEYNIQTRAWLDKTSPTRTTDPHANPLGLGYDMSHTHSAFVAMCDPDGSGACAMGGAAHVKCDPKASRCPEKAAFGFVDNSKGAVQPYLDLVHAYGWGNYMFQTNQGPSYSSHQFLFGATSAPSADDDHRGIFVADSEESVGCECDAPSTARVGLINPQGIEFGHVFPCFERPTVGELLDARGVSWRYYGSASENSYAGKGATPRGIWIAPNSIKHICVAVDRECTGKEWTDHLRQIGHLVRHY
jgi:hypothetical protein